MPIGTSDGEYFDDAVHFEHSSFTDRANQAYRPSDNIEDARDPYAKWGSAFGPSEGGPPAGVDADVWYPYQKATGVFGKMQYADNLYDAIKHSPVADQELKNKVYEDTSYYITEQLKAKPVTAVYNKTADRIPSTEPGDLPTRQRPPLPSQ